MIDEEWLNRVLRFELPGGHRFDGVGGVGGSKVVIKLDSPDGRSLAVRVPKELFSFPCYIHEIPNWIAPAPMYDVARLNRKLGKLLGDPILDTLVFPYDAMFTSLVESPREAGMADFDLIVGESENATRALRYIMATPPIARRLDDLATSGKNPKTRAWARRARKSVDRLRPGDPEMLPESLLENPFFVWGAAIASGFFTKAEFPHALDAVVQRLDAASEAQAKAFLQQAALLVEGARDIVGRKAVSRLAVFCDASGFFGWQLATEEERAAPDEFLNRFWEKGEEGDE